MRVGLLQYRNTGNLGDEIQSIAARSLLPRVDCYLDRDDLGGYRTADGEPLALIVHGWFAHTPETWPPSPQIRPLLISLHLSNLAGFGPSGLTAREYFLTEPVLDYLKAQAPVGARDLATAELLEQRGVPAYFSGCLSLTLAPFGGPRGDAIVLNDVPPAAVARIRAETRRPIVETTHLDAVIAAPEARFAQAEALLSIYAHAHCVVTTRLHCMLPCLALGTPALMIDLQPDRERFSGLENYYRHCTAAAFLAGARPIDFAHPQPNRDDFKRLAAVLKERVAAFVAHVANGGAGAMPPAMDEATLAAARRNTLLALYARARAGEAALRRTLEEKEFEIERLRRDLAARS